MAVQADRNIGALNDVREAFRQPVTGLGNRLQDGLLLDEVKDCISRRHAALVPDEGTALRHASANYLHDTTLPAQGCNRIAIAQRFS